MVHPIGQITTKLYKGTNYWYRQHGQTSNVDLSEKSQTKKAIGTENRSVGGERGWLQRVILVLMELFCVLIVVRYMTMHLSKFIGPYTTKSELQRVIFVLMELFCILIVVRYMTMHLSKLIGPYTTKSELYCMQFKKQKKTAVIDNKSELLGCGLRKRTDYKGTWGQIICWCNLYI